MNKIKMNEIKELEKQAARIAKKKARLEQQLAAEKEQAKWYDEVLKESGYKRPRDLIKALMAHFGIRTVSLASKKRGPGRPRKAAAAKTAKAGKRKRTKVTAALRDEIKKVLADGQSKNAIAKKYGISYIVIKKIADGGYDKLKA